MLKLRVPATSANLGPGFDCIGLALDLWNDVSLEEADAYSYEVQGEGAAVLNGKANTLLTRAFLRAYEVCGRPAPRGMRIRARNGIPVSSGLGSSAAAILIGLYAANELLERPLDQPALLELANGLEGHPDNVSAALLGGLAVSAVDGGAVIARSYEIPELTTVVIVPDVDWPTQTARSVLPDSVSRADAVYNVGRAVLVFEALRLGDLDLLRRTMDDRLHQPFRLARVPGGEAAWRAGREFGAAALSGAGPSIIAFVQKDTAKRAQSQMISAFQEAGISSRGFVTRPSPRGIHTI